MTRFFQLLLIANGAYLAVGSLLADGDDAGVVLRHGGCRWQLIAFGVPAVAAGLYLWNGLGPKFGLGPAQGKVDRRAALAAGLALLLVVLAELALSP